MDFENNFVSFHFIESLALECHHNVTNFSSELILSQTKLYEMMFLIWTNCDDILDHDIKILNYKYY
jgi:hypothetical protein